jgi:hypothetical protein
LKKESRASSGIKTESPASDVMEEQASEKKEKM